MIQPIRIIGPSFQFLGEIDDYESLQFTRRYNKIGEFELHINVNKNLTETLQEENFIFINERKVGVIRYREINRSNSEQLIIKGYTLKGILSRRIALPSSGLAYDSIESDLETVMKHYVDNNAVSTSDPNRKIPNLVIANNMNRGPVVSWDSRYQQLDEELTALSTDSIGWHVYMDLQNSQYVFDIIVGRNLTVNQATLPPVIFSIDFDNVKNEKFIESGIGYRNTAYVGGQGEGAERKIVQVGTEDNFNGLYRFETFIDARDVENEANLPSRGLEKLKEFEKIVSFESEILPYGPFIYEQDWDFGDIVTVQDKKLGVTLNTTIAEVREIYESSGFTLEVIFGKAMPTIIDKIKQVNSSPMIETSGSTGGGGTGGTIDSTSITNVKSFKYGGTFDGIADDTTAVQAAINDAITTHGGIIFFPRGNYNVTGLTFNYLYEHIKIDGSGQGAKLLNKSTVGSRSAATLNLGGSGGKGWDWVEVSDIYLRGVNETGGGGIWLDNVNQGDLTNVKIERFHDPNYGIGINFSEYVFSIFVKNPIIVDCAVAGVYMSGACNANTIHNGWIMFNPAGSWAVKIVGGNSNTLHGTIIEDNANGVYLAGNNSKLDGCWIEENGLGIFANETNAIISNCWFYNNTKNMEIGSSSRDLIIENCHFEVVPEAPTPRPITIRAGSQRTVFKNCTGMANVNIIDESGGNYTIIDCDIAPVGTQVFNNILASKIDLTGNLNTNGDIGATSFWENGSSLANKYASKINPTFTGTMTGDIANFSGNVNTSADMGAISFWENGASLTNKYVRVDQNNANTATEVGRISISGVQVVVNTTGKIEGVYVPFKAKRANIPVFGTTLTLQKSAATTGVLDPTIIDITREGFFLELAGVNPSNVGAYHIWKGTYTVSG